MTLADFFQTLAALIKIARAVHNHQIATKTLVSNYCSLAGSEVSDGMFPAYNQYLLSQPALIREVYEQAQTILFRYANEQSVPPRNPSSVQEALAILYSSMAASSSSITLHRASFSSTSTNNSVIAISDYSLSTISNAYSACIVPETITVVEKGVSQNGDAIYELAGEYASSNSMLAEYPTGSACSKLVTSTKCGSTANLITNGHFTSVSSGFATGWSVVNPTCTREPNGGVNNGPYILMDKNSASNPKFAQTTAGLSHSNVFFLAFRAIRVAGTSGNLIVDVVNSFGFASKSIPVSSLPTTWNHQMFYLAVPFYKSVSLQSSQATVSFELSAPNGVKVGIDEVIGAYGTLLYPGGPYTAIFNADGSAMPSYSVITVTSTATDGTWHRWFDRLYGAGKLQLHPYDSTSPTFPDSMLT